MSTHLCKYCRTALSNPRRAHPCKGVDEMMSQELVEQLGTCDLGEEFWLKVAQAALKSVDKINHDVRTRF